ncbi:MAG: hypothetical protein HDR14_10695 [Lachnospiraceae bacterium]|nr:hypothetical protein [Lachnospiraceae bacterium]
MKKEAKNKTMIPTLKFNSDWFECRKCGYKEMRLVLGDISSSPCPECGNSPMYRVK